MVRDKGASRRVCYFAQVSPPKDVSILHLVGGDARFAGWWKDAVAETLAEMEAVVATRVRKAGANADRRTANMVGAIVTHDANRDLDPQLHTHLSLMNLTFDPVEARWKSLQPSGFFRHQGFFREVCYNRLAARMLAAGYEVEPARKIGFTIKGLPAELRERFSKRRRAIVARAAAEGATSQDELQDITVRTRAAKRTMTTAKLRARWATECGSELATVQALIRSASGTPKPTIALSHANAVRSAEAHAFERRSVVPDRTLLREALIAGRGQVSLEGLRRAAQTREAQGDLIRSTEDLTSKLGLEAEREFTGWANTRLSVGRALGQMPGTPELDAAQFKVVRELLASPSGVIVFQGDAGTGKTRCLTTVVRGIESAGGMAFSCAPSAGAADALRRELGRADTLQQLLVSETLQRSIRGSVLIVDEAGLISVREMRDLCCLAQRNGHRLLLVGDIKQHSSVEAGDALRSLQKFARVPVFLLTEIRRQRDPAYRAAVALLAQGDAFKAFGAFKQLGAVREVSRAQIWDLAAADYVRTVRAGETCLAISPVWSEIHRFTASVREHLKLSGLLDRRETTVRTVHSLKWTAEERARVQNYQRGDVLTFHRAWGWFKKFDTASVLHREARHLVVQAAQGTLVRFDPRQVTSFDVGLGKEIPVARGERLLIRANLPAAGLKNGDIVEVAALEPDGRMVCRDTRILPASFREFSHGYATTSHAAQGKTVERGLLLMADEGIAAGNLKQAYVSNSRFQESQLIFTTDAFAAQESMMRSADRKLALELGSDDVPPILVPHEAVTAQSSVRAAA